MSVGNLYTNVLPYHISEEASSVESQRFVVLIETLSNEWTSTSPRTDRVNSSLKWVAVINSFITSRGEFPAESLNILASTVLDVVLNSDDDRFAQVRWCSLLARVLRQYRFKLQIVVPWRQLYDLVVKKHLVSGHGYEGAALVAVHAATVSRLIRRSRRFFPPEAAAEIWAEFTPALSNYASNAALEGMGFLVQFLPTQRLSLWQGDAEQEEEGGATKPMERTKAIAGHPWAEWASNLMQVWEGMPHCKYWTACLLGLFSRLAKHDQVAAVDWPSLLPRLLTQCLWALEIPVGGSLASSPVGRRTPRECLMLFSGECVPRARAVAKLLIYLVSQQGGSLPHITTLTDYLENYYHPSNGGQWTSALTTFLRHSTSYFVKRLASEANRERLGQVVGNPINAEQRGIIIQCLMRLVNRGHFSKNASLGSATTSAMGVLAYVEPTAVLPLVVRRFDEALETVTATHQLVAAMDALAVCIRPLLLHPTALPDIPVDAMLAQALMATLPGIDANDPAKTLATLKLYSAVLSSSPLVCEAHECGNGGLVPHPPSALNYCYAEWLDCLLERLFLLFSNVDQTNSRGGGGDGHSANTEPEVSFLMYGSSMYRPFMELLFARLSPSLFEHSLKTVATFLHTTTLAGAVSEVGVMTAAVVWAGPEAGVARLMVPVALKVLAEAATICPLTTPTTPAGVPGVTPQLSSGQEAAFRWWVGVLTAGLHYAGAAVVPHRAVFQQVLEACFRVAEATSSMVVGEGASQLLSSLLGALVCYLPLDEYRSMPATAAPPLTSGGDDAPSALPVEQWIEGDGEEATKQVGPVIWHIPTEVEKELVQELLEQYLERPLRILQAMCQEGSGAEVSGSDAAMSTSGGTSSRESKDALRVLLLQLEGAMGVRSSLPDFALEGPPCKFLLAGQAGITVGREGTRERMAQVLHGVLVNELAADPESLLLLMRLVDDVLGCARREFSDWQQSLQVWRTDASVLTQPKVAALYAAGQNGKKYAGKLQKARPRWLVLERAFLTNQWRASQVVYFAGMPHRVLPCDTAPYTLLVRDLHMLTMHRYKAVRQTAQPMFERCLKRFPDLVQGCLPPLLRALSDKPPVLEASDQTSESNEEAALGACTALCGRMLCRFTTRNTQAMADVLLALMASAHHSTPRSQSSISDLFMVLALRFSRVVLNNDTAATAATLAATRTTLMEMLALEGKSGVAMHWRYTLMANTALLFTLRPGKETIADAVMMAKHALGNTCYELAPLRPLAIATLLLLLKVATPQKVKAREAEVLGGETNFAGMEAWRGYRQRLRLQEDVRRSGPDQPLAEAATAAAREAVRVELSGDTISRLMTMLALNHSQNGSGGSAGAFAHTALGGDTLSRAVVALSAARDWPRTKGKASAVQSGAFSLLHVRLFKHLVRLGGSVALEGLRGPLTEACTSADRPHQCLAAEVFAGLLRAGTVPLEEGADWGEWVAPLLIKTLLDTPNELVSEWTAAIRYAVAGHSKEGLPTRRAVLAAIAKPVPPGSPSGLEAKRLSILTAALMEMATRTPDEPFSLALLAELEGLFPHPSRQVREEAAACMAVLTGALCQPLPAARNAPRGGGIPGGSLAPAAPPALAAAVESLMHRMVAAAEDDAALLIAQGNTHRRNTENTSETADAPVGGAERDGGEGELGSLGSSSSGSLAGEDAAVRQATCRFETTMMWMVALVKSGDAPYMLPTITRLLGPLLRVQEVADRDLATLAKRTLAYMKYLPMPPRLCPNMAATLQAGCADPLWHTRVATLNFLQAFIFRHCFVLDAPDAAALRLTVMGLLSDPQLEVRELAALTTSGLVRGADTSYAFKEELRTWSLKHARQAQAEAARERKRLRALRNAGKDVGAGVAVNGAAPGRTLAEKHGPILGLSALVMSAPYDVPAWLPEVLLVLAGASSEPPPIRDTVTNTLADFKKTHLDTWAATRAAFSEEQWDAFMDLSLSPSYFV